MDDTNTNNTNMSTGTKNTRENTRAKKLMLGLLVGILILALGGLAGYFVGQADKQQAADHAKEEGKAQAHQEMKPDTGNNTNETHQSEKAPAKTVTETTCNADELSLTTAGSADSGAGTLAYDLVLTNIGERTCTLGGFPGVSLVNDNGNQIGTPAERATNYVENKLTLAPQGKVKAVVSVSNPTNFSDGQCKTGATKFRVYPPNDTGYLSVASTVDSWCPGFMISPVLAM